MGSQILEAMESVRSILSNMNGAQRILAICSVGVALTPVATIVIACCSTRIENSLFSEATIHAENVPIECSTDSDDQD